MTAYTYNPRASSVTAAKLRRRLPRLGVRAALAFSWIATAGGIAGLIFHVGHSSLLFGLGLIGVSFSTWLRRAILGYTPEKFHGKLQLDQILPAEVLAGYHTGIDATGIWQLISPSWQINFMATRFNLPYDAIATALVGVTLEEVTFFETCCQFAETAGDAYLSLAAIMVGLLNQSPVGQNLMTQVKIDISELTEGIGWIARYEAYLSETKPLYGGIARDWASGYTPVLNSFGDNFSRQVEASGGQYAQLERTVQLSSLVSDLGSATGSVVLVGETGIGKTALLYGLAEQLLLGDAPKSLRHHQIISLSAAAILARVSGAGDIERIVMTCFHEALQAGNIIIALDEAQLFFGQGTGAVNLSQLLLPIVQSRRVKLILTLSPGAWQSLRSTNVALSGLLTPMVLSEPSSLETLRLLADRSLSYEAGRFYTTWDALRQAKTMSARYDTDNVNPGRSLRLLEAAYNFPLDRFVRAQSIDQAIESQYGVKVQVADKAEADVLLNLEAHIHERMINQSRAVSVVASALRRARAGVSNPKRPIGSFLFLGPTGVGKTELAKSLAALYFGDEKNMIRLDMSEYQQASDVSRLLAGPAENPYGLLPRIKQQPFSVVLLDEIEKASPNILNLLLQLLDEGALTDSNNKPASFKDAIIIATSNAGADEIRAHIEAGDELASFERQFTDTLISQGSFKPELLNRFDEIVLFRPLNEDELVQVVGLLIHEVNRTLEPQKVRVELAEEAARALVHVGYDPRLGARPMRRMVQRSVEDAVAQQILRGEAGPGTVIKLSSQELNLPTAAAVSGD